MIRQIVKNIPFLYKLLLSVKHMHWNAKTKRAINIYLNNNGIPKLQLGAGLNKLPGWFNTDYFARPRIFFLDVTKSFPFANDTFQWVFSEHHIEHITYKQAQHMLNEVFRVMKPGAYIKITTPDLEKYIMSYANHDLQSPIIKQHAKEWIYSGFANASTYVPADNNYEAHFINDIFLNYEHRFIYNAQALKIILEKSGFANIVNQGPIEYSHKEFERIETHLTDFDQMFTLNMQAQKPL